MNPLFHEIINVIISAYYEFPLTKIQSCLSGLERGRSAWLECICLWLASVSVSQRENLQSVAWPVWWKQNQWLHLFACSTITKRVFRYLLFWRARRCRPYGSMCWIPPWWTGSEKTRGLPVCMKQCLQEIMRKQNETMLVCYWCKISDAYLNNGRNFLHNKTHQQTNWPGVLDRSEMKSFSLCTYRVESSTMLFSSKRLCDTSSQTTFALSLTITEPPDSATHAACF